jgi:cyclopropane-fatty-acyl-phospholipid synthase
MTIGLRVKEPDLEQVEPALGVLQRLYRKIVLAALGAMSSGRLELTLPEGQCLVLGNADDRRVCATIRVVDESFFKRCVLFGHVGLSESYMDGHWLSDDVAAVIAWALLNINECPLLEGTAHWKFLNSFGFINQTLHWLRRNSIQSSRKNIAYHYDLSNELFKLFLDPSMTYSSAYFKNTEDLQTAQIAKYENLCRKLRLNSNDHVLEIGCGWGGFAEYAVGKYGCRITGVTISQEQFDYALKRISAAGLGERVDLRIQDYRKITEKFDKIVSIEMIEAVGDEYLDVYFKQCDRLLKADGLLAIQMITCPDSRYELLRTNTDFIQKHIFPGSQLLSHRRVSLALERAKSDLFLHDLEDMGNYYARTLEEWQKRFENRLDEVRALGFDEVFIRKWVYYLSYCYAAFAMRNISVVQAVYTRPNNLHNSTVDLLGRFSQINK